MSLHCLCQRGTGSNLSAKHSIAWRCHQSDTTVARNTWGFYSKERSIKELKDEAESLSWSVEWILLGRTMKHMSWGFWYLVIAVSIGWFMAIPRRFLGGMSPNLDGCPQQKSWQVGVILLPLGFRIFRTSVRRISHFVDEIFFFQVWRDGDSESAYETFGQHCSRCLHVTITSFLTTCHFSYHEIFLEDPRVSKWMLWIKITAFGWL